MNKRAKLFSLIFVLLMFFTLYDCTRVPITGRKQLVLLPESQMVSMGITNYKGFLDTVKLSNDYAKVKQVQKVGNDIASAVEKYLKDNGLHKYLENFQWEFNLVEYDVPNAWCMPGGKVCFYTGILPYTQDENGIAVVMGHEIAHTVARHGNERMTQQLLAIAGGMALSEFTKSKPQETQNIFLSVYSVSTQLGVLLPYSRTHEYEADRLGLIFMAMAGYDPQAAVAFWTRMSQISGTRPPEFLSTHPADEKRIENLKKILPEAQKYYVNK